MVSWCGGSATISVTATNATAVSIQVSPGGPKLTATRSGTTWSVQVTMSEPPARRLRPPLRVQLGGDGIRPGRQRDVVGGNPHDEQLQTMSARWIIAYVTAAAVAVGGVGYDVYRHQQRNDTQRRTASPTLVDAPFAVTVTMPTGGTVVQGGTQSFEVAAQAARGVKAIEFWDGNRRDRMRSRASPAAPARQSPKLQLPRTRRRTPPALRPGDR